MSEELLSHFLQPQVETPPELTALLAARGLLHPFIALFRGGDDEVVIRLHVLQILAARHNPPRWQPMELEVALAHLQEAKRQSVLLRLKEYGLLLWEVDSQSWQVASSGRMALAALTHLFSYGIQADTDLAYITAEVAGAQALGKVPSEVLSLLLNKYKDLQISFEQAIQSGSEFRLRAAQSRLESVWQSVQQGIDIIKTLTERDDLDHNTWRAAQAIGLAQAHILRMASTFHRELARVEQNRVLMGNSGLSTRDLAHFLRHSSPDELLGLLGPHWTLPPQPAWLDTETLADIAEYELLRASGAELLDEPLPPAQAAPTLTGAAVEKLAPLEHWLGRLNRIDSPTALSELVLPESFAESSYRLSLLGLLGANSQQANEGDMDADMQNLMNLRLQLRLSSRLLPVQQGEIAALSEGLISPQGD